MHAWPTLLKEIQPFFKASIGKKTQYPIAQAALIFYYTFICSLSDCLHLGNDHLCTMRMAGSHRASVVAHRPHFFQRGQALQHFFDAVLAQGLHAFFHGLNLDFFGACAFLYQAALLA